MTSATSSTTGPPPGSFDRLGSALSPQSPLSALVAAELPAAVELRHDLHRHAELSGGEARTAAAVAAALGDPDALVVARTGRLIRIGPAAGPAVAIRAELDALPIAEETGAAWSSVTGAMHACGHDVHLAALTAVGRAVRRAGLPVAMLAVLQPREETSPSGARDIASDASFAAQRPAAMIGAHLQHQVPPGTVAAAAGAVNAATDDFEITVRGTGGHAGYPHLAADPVLALCQSVVALQHLVSRRIDPTHAAVVSVGSLRAGAAANVIPPTATAAGTIRTLAGPDREFLRGAVTQTVADTCRAYGCEGAVAITPAEPMLVNDPRLTAACQSLLRAAGQQVDAEFRSCGADDFSYYSAVVPTLMLFVGSGTTESLHHPRFLPGDDAIGQVATAMLAGYLAAVAGLAGS
ncbi:MAG TPA: amidohydrolase [Streptosporangiaceae bacterium]|nr:amidohydrolase [Streptosporangiaceae bacterium]